MSASSFQSGFPCRFAERSQTALTTAAVARWMTPFSGPSQRSCVSEARLRQKPRMSALIDSEAAPHHQGSSARTAATQTSVPRPVVNVRPWPSSAVVGIGAQDDVGRRVVGIGVHRVRAVQPTRSREADVARLQAHNLRGAAQVALTLPSNNPIFSRILLALRVDEADLRHKDRVIASPSAREFVPEIAGDNGCALH